MQIVVILAVLAALASSEAAPNEPVSGGFARLMIAGAAVVLVAGFAMVSSGLIAWRLRADLTRHALLLRRFRLLRRIHAALWLIAVGGIFYGLEWGQLVRFNWHLDRVFLLDELLILAPVVLPLMLSWAAFYEVDRAMRVAWSDAASSESEFSSRGKYLLLHVRHYLGLLLLPVLGLLIVQDTVELLAPQILASGREIWVFVPTLAVMLLLFPVLLRYVWQTRTLPPGSLRSRLEESARRSGLRIRDVLVWQTDGMVLNAAVAGFLRPWRYVFLSDALLREMDDAEIEAVFGHEVGHVRHHHLLLRVMAMVAPLSLWVFLGQMAPEAVAQVQRWLHSGVLGTGGLVARAEMGLLVLAAMAVYVVVVFGRYCRLLEHQADLFGCRSMAAEGDPAAVETFASALEKLAAGNGIARKSRSWQHASVARRIDFLQQLSRAPDRELHFQRQVNLLSSLVILVVISPLLRILLG